MSLKTKKEKRFEKVVEWDNVWIDSKHIKDDQFLKFLFISMIPIFGQILFVIVLMSSLKYRKVYWREIK